MLTKTFRRWPFSAGGFRKKESWCHGGKYRAGHSTFRVPKLHFPYFLGWTVGMRFVGLLSLQRWCRHRDNQMNWDWTHGGCNFKLKVQMAHPVRGISVHGAPYCELIFLDPRVLVGTLKSENSIFLGRKVSPQKCGQGWKNTSWSFCKTTLAAFVLSYAPSRWTVHGMNLKLSSFGRKRFKHPWFSLEWFWWSGWHGDCIMFPFFSCLLKLPNRMPKQVPEAPNKSCEIITDNLHRRTTFFNVNRWVVLFEFHGSQCSIVFFW